MTPEQLELRRQGIGGSDAPAVLGISPWATPLDVYLDKVGTPQPKSGEWLEWGNHLEAIVADVAAQRMGVQIRRVNKARTHPNHDWMRANLDRDVVGQRAIFECKTAGMKTDEWGDPGTDQVPVHYLAQCAHYLAVMDYDVAYLPVLFMLSRKLEIYKIQRDPGVEQQLIRQESDFWHDHVLAQRPPPISRPSDIKRRWPQDNGGDLEANEELQRAIASLRVAKAGLKRDEEAIEGLESAVKTLMGEQRTLLHPDGHTLATWKTQKSRRFDAKRFAEDYPTLHEEYKRESLSRVFRLKKEAKQ